MEQTMVGPAVLTAPELAALLEGRPGIRLLDVRTPGEFERVHIPGAYNVPLDALEEHAAAIGAAVSDPVVLVCQSGARARRAAATLAGSAIGGLHLLDGGVEGWVAAGRPVTRGAGSISLERQVRIVAGSLVAAGAALALTVSPRWAVLPAFVGSGLVFAGVTDTCGMAMVLAKLPYNRAAQGGVDATVAALKSGAPAAAAPRAGVGAARSCSV